MGSSGVLTQITPENGERQVVAYASCSLSYIETQYGQVEWEALAIYFSCIKFICWENSFRFPLIINPSFLCLINLDQQMPYRIERIRMKLWILPYDLCLVHVIQVILCPESQLIY